MKVTARFSTAAISGAAFLLLVAARARARVVEKVAAVVGDNIVLASEVEEKAGPLMADVNKIPDPDKRSTRAQRRSA